MTTVETLRTSYPYETSPEVARYQCVECGAWSRSDQSDGQIRHSRRCDSKPQPLRHVAHVSVVEIPASPHRVYEVDGLQTHDLAEATALAGRPALTGTAKQVMWATEIRARLAPQIEQRIAMLSNQAARLAGRGGLAVEERDDLSAEVTYLQAFLAHTDAGLWIGHKNYSASTIWRGRGVGTASKYGLPDAT